MGQESVASKDMDDSSELHRGPLAEHCCIPSTVIWTLCMVLVCTYINNAASEWNVEVIAGDGKG